MTRIEDYDGLEVSDFIDAPTGDISSQSLTTEQAAINGTAPQIALDGYVVPVAPGLSANDAVDPSTTTTPVQDAIDLIGRSNPGAVLFPPTRVDEDAPILGTKLKAFLGWRRGPSGINFTDLSASGVRQDPNLSRDIGKSYWSNLLFYGVDQANRTGGAAFEWNLTANTQRSRGVNFHQCNFNTWGGPDPVIKMDPGGAFEFHWDYLDIANFDGTAIDFNNGGVGMSIGSMVITSHPSNSAPCIKVDVGGEMQFDHISMMEHAGVGVDITSRKAQFLISQFHFENSSGTDITNIPAVVRVTEPANGGIWKIRMVESGEVLNVDSIVDLNGQSIGCIIGALKPSGGVTVNDSKVTVRSEPIGPSWYFGPASDITKDGTWTDTGYVRSLDTAGTGNA